MIESNKKKWFNDVFSLFVKERQIRPFFHTINVRADDVPTPGLFLATHSSFWDGLILLMLNQHYLRHDVHVLMDEEGLRRFPFFRHLGAFSIQKGNLSEVRASLGYASDLLEAGKSVWVFPQGREYPQEHRPLEIGTGATMLLTKPDVRLCAIYYAFESHAAPVVYVRFRNYTVVSETRRLQKRELAEALERLYDDTRADVIEQSTNYVPLFPPKRSLADWTEHLLTFRRGGR
ncbi:MAG: lysophospholipid acyltransferase family protein [Exiguobacterium sp.]|uniref:Lysophospholipid acyltransferase family protein n=1 Tax=Exiguobacterium alkaliphilum TaxID=1428684 RepID=A0ABT2L020_9BACL|nr:MULTISPECIES: lysophospholipid acyltransferase family protein [Exiguobacterium]MDX5323750.1 lysophospholipid acyltransferase family protein [Exiguobacterium sp.]KDN58239.1 glycerol acyltransferase [Exiguobacterium sp. AB2]MCT4796025.1 lysophospholipid acyltransferase family protein [Exiguobacterium alkaliphilum]MDX5425558.1 lysophospholipid acyltransferase family protein [Exiguobacterium sp.]MDX6772967.1 lysophospholipid acyltransferase family protein [Exiguobacterium sp.]